MRGFSLTRREMVEGLENLLTIPELAEKLRLSVQTIQRYVLHREIPCHRIKKAVRFRPSEIARWIDRGGMTPTEGPDTGRRGDLFAYEEEAPENEGTEGEWSGSGGEKA
ncbi:MAG: helix-turn-helix domain-containing protein [Spirochaetales bacterium]|jgi:excisionase family DNA binding protein|nr:helix-turn-helix domain-containing protein [Spirochaetales bacterium]